MRPDSEGADDKIVRGRQTAGSRRGVFVVWEDGSLEDLATGPVRTGDGAPGISGRSVDGEPNQEFRTVQGIAANLMERIRKRQPVGPYQVAGVGRAGVVAYEIAIQLLGADQEVAFLGLVETEHREWSRRRADLNGLLEEDMHPAAVGRALQRAVLQYEVPESPLVVHLLSRRRETASAWSRLLRRPGQLRTIDLSETSGAGESAAVSVLRAVAGDGTAVPAETGGESPERSYRAPVTIQKGWSGVPCLFCVPGAGAGITDFVPLANALGEHVPVRAFQTRGMDGTLVPHSTVQAAARRYVEDVLQMSRGPVHLVGHSFGGWIAFEMALRLQAMRRSVLSLTLLDTEAPLGPDQRRPEYTRAEALMKLVCLYEQAAERSLDIQCSDLEALDPRRQLTLLHQRLVGVNLMPPRSDPESLLGPVRCFETAIRTRYSPGGELAGPATLILVADIGEAEERTQARCERVARDWRTVAPRLRVQRGPGNHIRLLRPPHIGAVAAVVGERFRQSSHPGSSVATRSPA